MITASRTGISVSPEVLEPRRRQFAVPDRVLDVFVPEIRLQCASVVALIRQRKPAGVPQHVRVRFEAELCLDPRPVQHSGKPGGREWAATQQSLTIERSPAPSYFPFRLIEENSD